VGRNHALWSTELRGRNIGADGRIRTSGSLARIVSSTNNAIPAGIRNKAFLFSVYLHCRHRIYAQSVFLGLFRIIFALVSAANIEQRCFWRLARDRIGAGRFSAGRDKGSRYARESRRSVPKATNLLLSPRVPRDAAQFMPQALDGAIKEGLVNRNKGAHSDFPTNSVSFARQSSSSRFNRSISASKGATSE